MLSGIIAPPELSTLLSSHARQEHEIQTLPTSYGRPTACHAPRHLHVLQALDTAASPCRCALEDTIVPQAHSGQPSIHALLGTTRQAIISSIFHSVHHVLAAFSVMAVSTTQAGIALVDTFVPVERVTPGISRVLPAPLGQRLE